MIGGSGCPFLEMVNTPHRLSDSRTPNTSLWKLGHVDPNRPKAETSPKSHPSASSTDVYCTQARFFGDVGTKQKQGGTKPQKLLNCRHFVCILRMNQILANGGTKRNQGGRKPQNDQSACNLYHYAHEPKFVTIMEPSGTKYISRRHLTE